MILIKKRNKNRAKSVFIKFNFIIAFYLLTLLSYNCKDFFKYPTYNELYNKFKEDNFFRAENKKCDEFDPIFLMGERFKKKPINICKNNESIHICYVNSKYSYYNKIAKSKYGVICQSTNFILYIKVLLIKYIEVLLYYLKDFLI